VSIDSKAHIDPAAEIGDGVAIGPFAVVGAGVRIGDNCRIGPHACLLGPLELGADCVVGFSAAIGHDPQVTGTDGPFGATRIGNGNVFREFVSVHRSMKPDGETVLGDRNYLMAQSHVGHDCVVGDDNTFVNNIMLAGHIHVGNRVMIGGGAGIHQFSRVGDYAMIGGNASIQRDVPPYTRVTGDRPSTLSGLNVVGLRRGGIDAAARKALNQAYRILFRGDAPVAERLAAVDVTTPEVGKLVEFLKTSERGVIGFGMSRD
jgi:UDP-N-acetylglucosamine acyltransferase